MTQSEIYTPEGIRLYGPEGFEGMRKAGALTAQALDIIGEYIVPGVSTDKLDEICAEFGKKHNAIAAPLGYGGSHDRPPFPKSICTSVNHVVCHGIPAKDKILREGDIINIDITYVVDGWYGDSSRMY
ncbi:MAG: M24 family metallopeptidase, partial [Micavibrio sp.]|nr:M24 family metallopeptidase [Micavibrio sp.]